MTSAKELSTTSSANAARSRRQLKLMPVLAVFRELIPEDAKSVAEARSRLAEIAGAEQGVFSHYPALAAFALGESIVVQ